jgi:hypothetical protein
LVSGTPIAREMLDFTRVTPIARFHENPPLFTIRLPLLELLPDPYAAAAANTRAATSP